MNYDDINVDVINMTLEKGIINDYLFDNYFFHIRVELDKPIDFIYRRLWEAIYLRTKKYSIYDKNSKLFTIKMSLSEAMQFINAATPPILQYLIKDSTNSLSSIIDVLDQFLIDDNSGHLQTYHSIFKRLMHLEPFDTKWEYDTTHAEILRKHNPVGLVGALLTSNHSICDIMSHDKLDSLTVHVLFHCQNDTQLNRLIDIIQRNAIDSDNGYTYITNQFIILNINRITNGETYIMAYSPDCSNSVSFRQLISTTYSEFYNNK